MHDGTEPMSLANGEDMSQQGVPDEVDELLLEADVGNGTATINVGNRDGLATGSLVGTGRSLLRGERLVLRDVRVSEVFMLSSSGARLLVLAVKRVSRA